MRTSVYLYAMCATALLAFSAAESQPCTNATLNGAYAFQETGKHTEATGFNEFRSVGIMVFDGRGNAKFSTTLWFSDLSINPQSDEPVSYSVLHDCSFTFTYLNYAETFTGVIALNGQRLLWLETSGDPMRTGQADKMHTTANQ
jgi:hypothetical protein